jgi:hypothetical protein
VYGGREKRGHRQRELRRAFVPASHMPPCFSCLLTAGAWIHQTCDPDKDATCDVVYFTNSTFTANAATGGGGVLHLYEVREWGGKVCE